MRHEILCHHDGVTDSLAGRLLVATPKLTDPNFFRTVVLLCMHDDNGAFGVVLNRPLESVSVAEHVPAWSEHASTPAVVFVGGPVEPTTAIAIGRSRTDSDFEGWTGLTGRIGLVDLEANPDGVMDGLEAVRLFAGYSGWGAGQLESEIEDDAWFVVEAEHDDVFTEAPERLWRGVLQRQGGKLAMFAYVPTDPSLN